MNKQLQALLKRREAAVAKMKGISDAAVAREDASLTAEERTEFDAIAAQLGEIDADINRTKALIEATRNAPGVTIPDNATITTEDNRARDETHGFRTFGEFAQLVRRASGPNARPDERLTIGAAAASSYGNVGSGEDGGFLVPPQFSREIITAAFDGVHSLLSLTENIPLSGDGNGIAFPVDESTPWGGGVQAYWTNEAQASQQSKASFQPAQMRLHKLTAMTPMTEEVSADASALGAYLAQRVPEAIMWRTNEALFEGDGIAKPLGVMRAGALVVVDEESAQAADTIVLGNILKMRARMPAMSYGRAIWMINNDALPQLDMLAYGQEVTHAPIYRPEGGAYGYGTLLGRPVMVTQFNETVGDQGDIALIDWKRYRTITKAGGIETATSMHFWFDQGINAFRAVYRIDGQPVITRAVTPNKGTATLSPYVVLEART